MSNNQKKYFPIFSSQRKKQTSNQTSNLSLENYQKAPSSEAERTLLDLNPVLSGRSRFSQENLNHHALDQTQKTPTSKMESDKSDSLKKSKQPDKRTKFHLDEEANLRLVQACNAWNAKELLPNGKKLSIGNCAEFYDVASSTLSYRTSGQRSLTSPSKPGRPSIFTKDELQKIVNHLLVMADLGYGYSEVQAMNLIRYISSLKPSNVQNFKASHGFMAYLFIQFPELAMRRALALDYKRATSLTKEGIGRFYDVQY